MVLHSDVIGNSGKGGKGHLVKWNYGSTADSKQSKLRLSRPHLNLRNVLVRVTGQQTFTSSYLWNCRQLALLVLTLLDRCAPYTPSAAYTDHRARYNFERS